jgi:hypothetical protein
LALFCRFYAAFASFTARRAARSHPRSIRLLFLPLSSFQGTCLFAFSSAYLDYHIAFSSVKPFFSAVNILKIAS